MFISQSRWKSYRPMHTSRQIVLSDIQARLHQVDLRIRFDDGNVKGMGLASTNSLQQEYSPTRVFVVFEVKPTGLRHHRHGRGFRCGSRRERSWDNWPAHTE